MRSGLHGYLLRRLAVGIVAFLFLIGLMFASSASAHPHGWHTWADYKQAHPIGRPVMGHKALSGASAAALADYLDSKRRRWDRWAAFDSAYWASLPRPEPEAPATGIAPVAVPTPAAGVNWDAIAACESGGVWDLNTGNGYYGGLQFSYSTWHGYGGGRYADYPHHASREQQIAIASGMALGHWPYCGRFG